MAKRRAIDGSNDGNFNVQKIQQQVLAFEINFVPFHGGHWMAHVIVAIGPQGWPTECSACSCEDDDLIVIILPDLMKGAREFAMWQ